MKKKILLSLVACFIAAGSFVHYNFAQNYYNMDVSLADISTMAQADGEEPVPGCVDVTFYPGNYTESDTYSICYLSDGTQCGKQRTCEADPTGDGCNETMCQGHTSG